MPAPDPSVSDGPGTDVPVVTPPRPVDRLHAVVRHRRSILWATLVVFVLAAVLGADAAKSLSSGGFTDDDAESVAAATALRDVFDQGFAEVVVLVTAADGDVDAPDVVARAGALEAELEQVDGVEQVVSYWSLGRVPPLRSTGGDRALMLVTVDASDDDRMLETAGRIREAFTVTDGEVIDVGVGGPATTFDQVNHVIEEDLVKAELIAFPLTLLLLLVIFGSVVAAALPLGIGALAIVGTFLFLETLGRVTQVSIFALNFTTAMGLGLAVDYSLLVVSRFREELAQGFGPPVAVARTIRTAGRTVVFSGGTVASSLLALLVFKQAFLKSFAYAGIAVVGIAVVASVVVLPALLAALGHRVNKWQVRKPRPEATTDGMWHRVAVTVMRRPVPIATIAILFLVFLGLPFAGIQLGFPDDRVLSEGSTREVGDVLRAEFASAEASAVSAIATDIGSLDDRLDEVDAWAAELSTLDGVARVDAVTGSYVVGQRLPFPADQPLYQRFAAPDATWVSVVPDVDPLSAEGEQLVADVRAADAPFDEVLVGGIGAEFVDGKAGLFDRLPLALAIIAGVTFVVLFLSFGSVLMPLKAIVLNLLSLSATFGAMVWVFQDGNLSDLLGFTATGTLVLTMPVLMFCVAFGLSMDYEVFLLSRVKEEWDRTGDNEAAVASGLEHTGRIVTAAAVLISVVFLAFSTGRVSFMKMFGIGLTLAVLVDAFIVRSTLVPAFMKLAGRWNWWAPAWLERVHDRWGFSEHVELDPPPSIDLTDGSVPADDATGGADGGATDDGRVEVDA